MRVTLLLALATLLCTPGAQAQRCAAPLPFGTGVPASSINPVIVRVLAPPVVPVPATDGLAHLSYAAQFTNLAAGPARIRAATPVDGRQYFAATGRNLVLEVDGAAINGKVRAFGLSPADPRDAATVAAGVSGIMFFDVTYPDVGSVPGVVVHQVTVQSPGDTVISTLSDPAPISCASPVVPSPPLKGHGWWNGNGRCRTVNAHRSATLPLNGDLKAPEQFAIDFMRITPSGGCCTGPVTDLRSWPFYGAPVLAAVAGKVVLAVDTMSHRIPGPPRDVSARDAAGNHVIQDIGGGRWILYPHLGPGSVSVEVGDELRPGQEIGRLGNSGSSTAPHLHFQVLDRPSALNAAGLPFIFDRQVLEGMVLDTPAEAEHAYESGRALRIDRQITGPRDGQMPAEGHVFGFWVRN